LGLNKTLLVFVREYVEVHEVDRSVVLVLRTTVVDTAVVLPLSQFPYLTYGGAVPVGCGEWTFQEGALRVITIPGFTTDVTGVTGCCGCSHYAALLS
jgi:hypothetical protein